MTARQLLFPAELLVKPTSWLPPGQPGRLPGEHDGRVPLRAGRGGVDIIETDLHLTADGVFVCIHDGTVDRTTDGHGAVADMTWAQIKALSASYGRPEFRDYRVPALAELCPLLAHEAPEVALAPQPKPTVSWIRSCAASWQTSPRQRMICLSVLWCCPSTWGVWRRLAVVAPLIPKGFITMSKLTPRGVDG